MAQSAFILVYSDNPVDGQRLSDLLRQRQGHACKLAAERGDVLDSIRERAPDVLVIDGRAHPAALDDELLEVLRGTARDTEVVVIASERPPGAAAGVRLTALPPVDDVAAYVERIGTLASKTVARREDRLLKQSLEVQSDQAFEGIIGASPAITRVVERVRKAARNKQTVLILGETGSGKELVARAIHRQSDRARRPFYGVNCAAFNENLLESELFGHVKGAFTGAVNDKKGIFVAADGGSLLLDEIGDTSPMMQVKLLRFLDTREVVPVGSTDVRRVDVRLIAATNADLTQMMEQNRFRSELYYRLNGFKIVVPPLRERRQDIPLLAHHFLKRANQQNNLAVEGISSEAMAALARYFWPGNIRELGAVVEATACEVENRQIEYDDLPEEIRGSREIVPVGASFSGLTMAQAERLLIERTLQLTAGNREQAAKMLDIGTRTLYRKIKEYGL